jgi:hypothetical protein
MISERQLRKIKRHIAREFPEFKGVEPILTEKIIKPQRSLYRKLALGVPKKLQRIFRLRFTKTIEAADHTEIQRILTVSTNEQGEIIKITESR